MAGSIYAQRSIMIKLTTAKEVTSVPPDVRALVARRSRNKGSNYEREVAKKIASYFGWKWDKAFYRTKPHGHAQPEGDIQPINEMYLLWKSSKLGPIECKNRAEWSWGNFFKNPDKSYIVQYWRKSNADTNTHNTVLIFTKAGMPDFVMWPDDQKYDSDNPYIRFWVGGVVLIIQTLPVFLKSHWSQGAAFHI